VLLSSPVEPVLSRAEASLPLSLCNSIQLSAFSYQLSIKEAEG